jgi:hypothetical protein
MRKVAVQLLALAICLLAGPLAQAQTVDEIINKNLEATGGVAKWKELKTMRMEGKFILPSMGIELPMSSYAKAPRMVRQEIDFQGTKVTPFTYDGSTPWKLMPPEAGGSGSPEKMSEDEAKEFVDDADAESPFIDYAAKGHQAELMGKEAIEGTECYKVKFTKKSGRVQYYFFDAETYALIMMRATQKNAMYGELEMDTFMSDYKEVNGLMVPHSLDVKNKGNSLQKLVWEKVVINEEIDDKIFLMPSK